MKILVIEDDSKILQFLEKGLKESGFLVDMEASVSPAWERLQVQKYDVIVLDVMLPGIDGLTFLGQIRAAKIQTPVLILSAKKTLEDRLAGLQQGGDDYLVKPFAFAELLVRLQVLLRRGAPVQSEEQKIIQGDMEMNLETREVFRHGKKLNLQMKEFNLLEYFMRNAGRVLTKTLILEKVWGYDFDPQTNVVDVLVCRLRNKVDKDFSDKLIQTRRGVGYVFKKD